MSNHCDDDHDNRDYEYEDWQYEDWYYTNRDSEPILDDPIPYVSTGQEIMFISIIIGGILFIIFMIYNIFSIIGGWFDSIGSIFGV
jgi:hypothetical protein